MRILGIVVVVMRLPSLSPCDGSSDLRFLRQYRDRARNGAAAIVTAPLACYLQSGQQPVPMRRVAADAPVAPSAMRRVANTRILIFNRSSPFARDGRRRFIRRISKRRG